ncbi:hypothetical protein WMF37_00845 [Sorangium sp. So ce291]|uniref:hypothetical protein n=1 Tax=Sorangium sp. So ce291 TaxID=3133294 RepID=UPI003F627F84
MPSPLAAVPTRAGRIGALLGGAVLIASHVLPFLHHVVVASLLALLLLAVGYRRPLGCTAMALGLTLLAPAILAHALLLLHQRVGLARGFLGETFDVSLAAYAAPLVAGLCGGLGSLLTGSLLRRERAWLPPALRAASLAALALAAALVAGTALRQIQRPGLDRYVASLPVAAVMPPVEGEPSRTVRRGFASVHEVLRVHELSVAGFTVTRTCDIGFSCTVSLGAAEHPPWPERFPPETVSATASLALRRDSAEDLVLIDPVDDPYYARPLAFRGPLYKLTDLYPRDLRRAAGPPLSWFAVAAAGLLFAGFIQRRRRQAREHLARLASAPAGTCDEAGWISFDEPLPGLRLELDDGCPAGRVLVLSGAADRAATYRSAGPSGPVEVLHGERGELVAGARSELVRLDALALSATLLATAPLVAAAWCGLVF